jgi:hypothetical protein
MIATHLNMCFACCTLKVFLFKLHSQVESPKPCRVLACEVLLDHSIGFAAAAKVPLGDGAEVPGLCNDSNILGVSQTLINTSTCSSWLALGYGWNSAVDSAFANWRIWHVPGSPLEVTHLVDTGFKDRWEGNRLHDSWDLPQQGLQRWKEPFGDMLRGSMPSCFRIFWEWRSQWHKQVEANFFQWRGVDPSGTTTFRKKRPRVHARILQYKHWLRMISMI